MSMTTTTPAPVQPDSVSWIRPWYSGGVDVAASGTAGHIVMVGHLYADCDDLLDVEADPREGAGWLDPRQPGTCPTCLYRHDPTLYAEIFGEEEDTTP
ncbi:hypothetical protein ACQP2T_13385 [Nonomuraea sp. CA-143628]|uniref:hypothetical protein n=1 Tax=Nonomuraea sp. CA-143628 TaxID=3239997 RepID=UPI003D947B85